MNKDLKQNTGQLLQRIQKILEEARNKVYHAANIEMLQAYWNIGREIVEEEQKGEGRAAYGSALIKELSVRLTQEYGKGFTETNLKYMRQFYQTFEKSHALRDKLSWTHYRILLKVEKENAREFYMKEAISGNWSTRQLERQINSLYFDRLVMSNDSMRIFASKYLMYLPTIKQLEQEIQREREQIEQEKKLSGK